MIDNSGSFPDHPILNHPPPFLAIPDHPRAFPKQKKLRLAKTLLRSESVGVAPGYVEGPVWWIPDVYKQKPTTSKKSPGGLSFETCCHCKSQPVLFGEDVV